MAACMYSSFTSKSSSTVPECWPSLRSSGWWFTSSHFIVGWWYSWLLYFSDIQSVLLHFSLVEGTPNLLTLLPHFQNALSLLLFRKQLDGRLISQSYQTFTHFRQRHSFTFSICKISGFAALFTKFKCLPLK